MTSAFDYLYSSMAVPVLMQHLGESSAGVYLTTRGGQKLGPFEAIVEPQTTVEADSSDAKQQKHVRIIQFPVQSGLPFWDGRSLVGAVVDIDSVDWAVEAIEILSPSLASVRVIRRVTTEVSRPSYRQK